MEEHLPRRCTAPTGARNPIPLFGGVDLISSLPDEIIHHIFSFVPTNLAITTRVLSKRWIDFSSKCVLSDVPSLIEANVDTTYYLPRFWCTQLDPSKVLDGDPSKDDEYQVMLQTMLEKLQNVEYLTVELSFLHMLSIAEFRGVPFPIFKVKTLTLRTTILRSAVLGIEKLLQNSPGLKKIKLYKTEDWNSAVEKYVNNYVNPQDPQHLIFPAGSIIKVAKPDLVASFMELLLSNTRTLETLVVHLGSCLNRSEFDELSEIALTLSHKNKVSIVLK